MSRFLIIFSGLFYIFTNSFNTLTLLFRLSSLFDIYEPLLGYPQRSVLHSSSIPARLLVMLADCLVRRRTPQLAVTRLSGLVAISPLRAPPSPSFLLSFGSLVEGLFVMLGVRLKASKRRR